MPSASPLIQRARLIVDAVGASKGFKQGVSGAKKWALSLAGAAAAALALTKIIGGLNERVERSIDRFQEQEKATIRLRQRFGDNTDEILRQGKALSDLTGQSVLAITQAQALSGAMGATAENVNALALGALNLSTTFGTDLSESSRQLSVTLGGLAGELTERVSELRGVTVAQLQAGEAADIINEKFAGAAAGGLTAYEKAIKAIENANIASSVAQGKATGDAQLYVDVLEDAVDIAQRYEAQTRNGSAATTLWATAIQFGSNVLGEFGLVLEMGLGFLSAHFGLLEQTADAQARLTEKVKETTSSVRSFTEINEAADKQLEDTIALFKDLGVVLDSEVNKQLDENRDKLDQLNEAYQNGTADRKDFERAEAALILKNAELTASLTEQKEVVEESTDTLEAYSDGFVSTRGTIEGLTGALGANSAAIRANAEAAAEADRRAQEREQRRSGGGFLGFDLAGGTFEFTTATGAGALRAQIERRAGLSAAGPAQQSDINLRGHTVPVPARAVA